MNKPLSEMSVHEKNVAIARLQQLPIKTSNGKAFGFLYGKPDFELNYCQPSKESMQLMIENQIQVYSHSKDHFNVDSGTFKKASKGFCEAVDLCFAVHKSKVPETIANCYLLMNGYEL